MNSRLLGFPFPYEWLKGLIVAAFSGGITLLIEALKTQQDINWRNIAYGTLTGLLAYLLKTISSNSDGKLFKADSK